MSRLRESLGRWGPWALLVLFWAWKTADIWRHVTSRHYALWGVFFDTFNMVWMSWWTDFAAHHGQGFFDSVWVNHPQGGATALTQSLAWSHVALAGLLRGIAGTLFAHNVLVTAGLAVSLVGVYLLLRHLSRAPWMAAVLTVLMVTYGLCWGRTLPDLELVSFGYIAFALLAWWRHLEAGGKWRLALAAFLVGWTGFVQMYYGLSLLTMLAMSLLLGWLGLTPRGIPARRLLVRTGQVLGLGLGVMVALHARNLVNVLGVTEPPNWDQYFRFAWWQGLLLLAAVVLPAVVAFLRLNANAFYWGALVLPVALLSMGEYLDFGDSATLSLPLHWVRRGVPLMWRITFCFRFVAPMLLALAAVYAALWRERDKLPAGEKWPALRAGAVLVGIFWLTAAFAPMVPRFELDPPGGAASTDEWCAEAHPSPCTLVQARVAWCSEGQREIPGPARWALTQLASPVLPLATVEMPPAPPCVAWLNGQQDRKALLEFAYREPLAYGGYFQTMHERPVAGFPLRFLEAASQLSEPSELAKAQQSYRNRVPFELPTAAHLAELGVGYVVVHRDDTPQSCQLGPSSALPLESVPGAVPDFAPDFPAAYGPPVCEDELLVIYPAGP